MEEIFWRKRALMLWRKGQRFQSEGDVERAIACYTESLDVFPTAEAYTFRGWAYGARNRLDDAIAECKKAISLDPTFGNPYNDIGSYLIAQGKSDDAIEWLELAKGATRYDAPHFPFMNLGRLFAARGEISRAIVELEGALHRCPEETSCAAMLARLRRQVN